jgi:hypothetical protein
MNDPALIERLRALRREASEIKSANRVYQARSAHTKPEMELHETQRRRLEEITKEMHARRGPASRGTSRDGLARSVGDRAKSSWNRSADSAHARSGQAGGF